MPLVYVPDNQYPQNPNNNRGVDPRFIPPSVGGYRGKGEDPRNRAQRLSEMYGPGPTFEQRMRAETIARREHQIQLMEQQKRIDEAKEAERDRRKAAREKRIKEEQDWDAAHPGEREAIAKKRQEEAAKPLLQKLQEAGARINGQPITQELLDEQNRKSQQDYEAVLARERAREQARQDILSGKKARDAKAARLSELMGQPVDPNGIFKDEINNAAPSTKYTPPATPGFTSVPGEVPGAVPDSKTFGTPSASNIYASPKPASPWSDAIMSTAAARTAAQNRNAAMQSQGILPAANDDPTHFKPVEDLYRRRPGELDSEFDERIRALGKRVNDVRSIQNRYDWARGLLEGVPGIEMGQFDWSPHYNYLVNGQ